MARMSGDKNHIDMPPSPYADDPDVEPMESPQKSRRATQMPIIEISPTKEPETPRDDAEREVHSLARIYRSTARILVFVSTLVVLLLGGTLPPLEPLLPALVFLLCAALAVQFQRCNTRPTSHLRGNSAFIALGLAPLVVAFIQTVPLPTTLLNILNPQVTAITSAIGSHVARGISLDPYATWQAAFWATAGIFGLFLLSSLPILLHHTSLYPTRRSIHGHGRRSKFLEACQVDSLSDKLELVLLAIGWVTAPIAILHWVLQSQALFGIYAPPGAFVDTPRAHWPLMNPNHLASILNVCALFALGRSLQTWGLMDLDPHEKARWEHENRFLGKLNSKKMRHVLVPFILYFVCASTVLLSASRAGLAILGVGTVALVLFSRESKHPRVRLTATVFLVALGILVLSVSGDVGRDFFASRIEGGFQNSGELRASMLSVSWETLTNAPLFGVGLGAWHLGVAPYQDRALSMFAMTYAHNDFLQLITEVGILGTLLLIGPVLTLFRTHAPGRDYFSGGEPGRTRRLTALIACSSVVVHAIVDFPFHVPAVVIVFILASAICLRLSLMKEGS